MMDHRDWQEIETQATIVYTVGLIAVVVLFTLDHEYSKGWRLGLQFSAAITLVTLCVSVFAYLAGRRQRNLDG